MAETATEIQGAPGTGESRRDFLLLTTTAVGAAGAALSLWPFVHSMNPAADVLALSSTEVDISPIEEGQSITVVWRGKPVFVRHRTAAEIETAGTDDAANLPDPQKDGERAEKPEWLVVLGICTHLGCIPLGQKSSEPRGEFGGWFCPCHGSHYDTSGRIRKGPAPRNLEVPPYAFTDDTTIKIG
ncbi:MAG: ubiquinol-cytochrome c reductase iron-sulfur subunit [Rhodospirillales bacterium]|nr:ubiquinol-cytochrome c reductase iron-sulfur subunit [Rhodospirillales bacterium]MCW8862128.1 ubiquinol-cytochrome c reductase iron-sulfur subunit [Rhodospirillales bacterium]MCW8952325.1 ubiquinol-cytochrome c reductase iron-sulfur subunit [Rhodospirillales bacterium]MCW8971184.1 ubiquinol-cytochrome c reductase iron-sulfur subunit [Rhodospirillales bacterium]MCW9002065.1 ubiquinol-cytochrome c reductase iron-sulfur subunit [Rhodospirillales bacterium]